MKLLHLEDNEADAELVAGIIARTWPECQITRLCTEREFKASLELENFDLVLSDYSMPGFDGISALAIVRAACPDTPFVFLSGTIGEERAIEALKHGAVDYVLKDSPARLLAAVRSALQHAKRESARRHAEEDLRKSREQFQQIAETIEDFIALLDERGQILYANPAFQKLVCGGRHAFGNCVFDRVHPEDLGKLRAFIENAGRASAGRDLEYRLVLPGGEVRHLEARLNLPRDVGKESYAFLLTGRDVTERKSSEEKLHEQASLLGKARDAICLISLEFAITYWNASAERVYGLPSGQAIGRNLRELLFASQASRFDTAFALTLAQGEWQGEFRLRHPTGRDVVIDSSWSLVNDAQGRPKSILCIDTDVTSRKQLEVELQRAQRIEGLGMLAGGIAHDLNNILSPILMSVGLLRPLVAGDDNHIILDTLESSAIHGTELVQQILLFARGGEGRRTEVRMGELLDQVEGFLRTTLTRAIELQMEHDSNLWSISADATQLKQVLVNLCVNARDAMPKGGRIRIAATNVRVSPGSQRGFHGEVPTGLHVRLSVADSGTGIPPEVLEKIFDPFFTTKELGKGTGLGLSTIAGIVQNHEGAIQVESMPGEGTTFHIYLPASVVPVQPSLPVIAEPIPKGRGELILVIDDDEGIRLVARKILESHNYEVCTAADGAAGLEEFRRQRDRIQAVICDQTMPGMKGFAVLGQIHREAPGLGLIAMSGLLEDIAQSDLVEAGTIILLPKPLKSHALVSTIRDAIEAAVL